MPVIRAASSLLKGPEPHDTLAEVAPIRDFNRLTRLLDQAESKLAKLREESGDTYAFDRGVKIRNLEDAMDEPG